MLIGCIDLMILLSLFDQSLHHLGKIVKTHENLVGGCIIIVECGVYSLLQMH